MTFGVCFARSALIHLLRVAREKPFVVSHLADPLIDESQVFGQLLDEHAALHMVTGLAQNYVHIALTLFHPRLGDEVVDGQVLPGTAEYALLLHASLFCQCLYLHMF